MNRHEPALLDLQNISVMRGEKIVLEDFSLVIRGDEHVAILGPNGCGKSTLIKTITRECYPVVREGSSMTILGQDRWDVFELRSLLGIVSNDLLSKSSGDAMRTRCGPVRILQQRSHLPASRGRSRSTVELADAALAQLEISHLARASGCEMSSGEARRVLIARALVHKPRALLFDEPSNSLDVFARHSLAPEHEFAGQSRHRNHSGDARSFRPDSGNRARAADVERTDHRGRTKDQMLQAGASGKCVQDQSGSGPAQWLLPYVVRANFASVGARFELKRSFQILDRQFSAAFRVAPDLQSRSDLSSVLTVSAADCSSVFSSRAKSRNESSRPPYSG